jgi:peptidoglycan hydrolase-like protein with peptidoglycan-binding domain
MPILALLATFVPALVQLIPQIISAWTRSSGNAIQKVAAVVAQTPIASTLADIGAATFPTLAPELHAAAAALVHAHPDNTAYVQDTLNFINATGYIKLDAPLVVDGSWGPKTKAAVMMLQAKLGVPSTGFFVDSEYSALSVLVSKFSGANINTALNAIVPPGAAAAVAAVQAAAAVPAAPKV